MANNTIFNKKDAVISSFIVPWIMGIGAKTPEEAKQYIKYGATLNSDYYARNKDNIAEIGEDAVYLRFMNRLFNYDNINQKLTKKFDEKVYKPWDCLSGIYQININDNMGLIARPTGVTKNNNCIIMVDDYISEFYEQTEEEIKIKLLATMAVWKANKGVYIINKMNQQITVDFDSSKWASILEKIKLWAASI